MEYEDCYSWFLRFHEYEAYQSNLEREAMFHEECEQCAVDGYWGIDLFEILYKKQQELIRQSYEQSILQSNQLLQLSKNVKKTNWKKIQLDVSSLIDEDVIVSQLRKLKQDKVSMRDIQTVAIDDSFP